VTGELTLSGALLPVASVKEKLEAAKSGGIKRVVLAMEDYDTLADAWKEDPDMEVVSAMNVYQLIRHCLEEGEGETHLGTSGLATSVRFCRQVIDPTP
jgi:ATP-dependent Lon protease